MAAAPLLADTRAACSWLASRGARALVTDSRRVQPGDAFIAWPGEDLDLFANLLALIGQAPALDDVAALRAEVERLMLRPGPDTFTQILPSVSSRHICCTPGWFAPFAPSTLPMWSSTIGSFQCLK